MRFPIRPWGSRSVATRPQGRPRQNGAGPGGRGQAEAAPVHRGVSAADPGRGGALNAARRGGPPASPRGVVQLASDDLAQGAAQGLATGVGREEARRETGPTQPAGCESARAGGESGSPGARVETCGRGVRNPASMIEVDKEPDVLAAVLFPCSRTAERSSSSGAIRSMPSALTACAAHSGAGSSGALPECRNRMRWKPTVTPLPEIPGLERQFLAGEPGQQVRCVFDAPGDHMDHLVLPFDDAFYL